MTKGQEEGVASVDGMIEADDVAEITMQEMKNGKFLVTPHTSVLEYVKRKGTDRDRWIKGM